VLFDLDFSQQDPLFVDSPGSGSATVQLFTTDDLRDFVLDCELGLHDGAAPDRYGLTFRQSAEERYAACTIDPNGSMALGLVDRGPALVIAEASLDASTGFRRGIGAVNRLSVVACGPAVGCMVNGVTVLGAVLDARYASGRAGALLVHTSHSDTARVAVRWAQARAILVETS
jgi:hypothetical protein